MYTNRLFCFSQDPRFNNEIDLQMGYRTHSILSTPIKDCDGVVIGVAQAINRTNCKDEPFNLHDEKVNMCLFKFIQYENDYFTCSHLP